jgi:hypothetical protein
MRVKVYYKRKDRAMVSAGVRDTPSDALWAGAIQREARRPLQRSGGDKACRPFLRITPHGSDTED